MNSYKLFFLLIIIVGYINYNNYFIYDVERLKLKTNLLLSKLDYEKSLKKETFIPSKLKNYENKFFDGKKYSNSKAMSKMQSLISEAGKDTCQIKNIQWGQVTLEKSWYEKLRINLSMNCTPTGLTLFANKLQKNNKFIYFENIAIVKDQKEDKLIIGLQLVSYRTTK